MFWLRNKQKLITHSYLGAYIYKNYIFCYFRDQLFPALGFGARLPPNGVVSHEFALVSVKFAVIMQDLSVHLLTQRHLSYDLI